MSETAIPANSRETSAATPIEAAELALREQGSFERYRNTEKVLTIIRGRLEEVGTMGEQALLIIRSIDGLKDYEMATALIQKPVADIDQRLKEIGRYGAITLIGMATGATEGIAKLRMDEVHSINGTDIRTQTA